MHHKVLMCILMFSVSHMISGGFFTSLSMRHGRQDVSVGRSRMSSAYWVDVTEHTASISPLVHNGRVGVRD
jgi:hypothetical protein